MSGRRAYFEVVRTAAGHHVRFRGRNGHTVWTTEVYVREVAALHAIELFTGNPVTVSRWGLEVFHEGTAELLEVRRLDERTR